MKLYLIKIKAVLCFLPLSVLNGCINEKSGQDLKEEIEVKLYLSGVNEVKSVDPGPDVINDLNIFILNADGLLEEHKYIALHDSWPGTEGLSVCKIRLIKGIRYSIAAFANFGYKIEGIKNAKELNKYRYHLTYPDEYSRGLPMCGKVEGFLAGKKDRIEIDLERLMSKISLRIDRTKLSKGVVFNVRSVRIGNCPKSVLVMRSSRAQNNMDVFNVGFMKSYGEVDDLNRDKEPGVSKEISVYMFENMNGDLLPEAVKDKDKILDKMPSMAEICSYIEIKAEYISPVFTNLPGDYLIYRFYLGTGKGNFDIKRNCHYKYTIRPEGSGLNENSWRVDIQGLKKISEGD